MSVLRARSLVRIVPALTVLCFAPAAFGRQASPPTSPPAAGGPPSNASANAPILTPAVKAAIAKFQTAQQLQKSGKSAEAIAAYQQFIRLAETAKMGNGAVMPALDLLYQLYQKRSDMHGMEATLQQIAKIAPQNPGVWVEFATLYLSERRLEEARSSAAKALKLNPPAPLAAQAHFVYGGDAFAHKQWTNAETEYSTAVRLMPDNPQYLFNLLLTLNTEKKTKQALAMGDRLLKLAPKMTQARMLLASIKQENRDPLGAVAVYNDILKYEPRNTAALFNRALLLQQLRRTDDAITAYSAYLDVVPKDFVAQYNLGSLYLNLHNMHAAQKHLAIAVQLRPKEVHALFNLALCERDLGFTGSTPQLRMASLDAAVAHFKQAIALDPKDEAIQIQLAALYQRANRFPEAIALFRKQQAADPDNPEPYHRLTLVYVATQQLDTAIAEWRKYRTRKPGDPASYGEIADLLEAQGKWQEASEERLEQIRRDPINGQAKLDLGREYRQLKQLEKAESEYKLVLDMDVQARDVGEKLRAYASASRHNWRRKAWQSLSELADTQNHLDEAISYLENIKQEEVSIAAANQKPPEAQTFLAIANLYERKKDFELARKEYTALLAARPDDPKAFAGLGEFEERQSHTEAAAAAFTHAEERAPDPVPYGLKVADVYQKARMFDKAIAVYTRLIGKYPTDPRLTGPLAEVLTQSHDDVRALALYDAMLKSKPNDPLLMDKKAVILARLKRYPEALVLREKIADLQPQDYQVYANTGVLYELEGKPEDYLHWLKGQVEKNPSVLPAMAAYIDASIKQKQQENGWKIVLAIVRKHNNDLDVKETYVSVLQQNKKLPEAIVIRREIATASPKDLEAITKLADLLVQNKQEEEAEKVLIQFAARTDVPLPSRQQARRILAQQLNTVGKSAEAIAQYRRILQEEPGNLSDVLALGRLLVSAGKENDALTLYEARTRQESTPPIVRSHFFTLIGDIYAKQGHKSEAQAQYQQALKLNPQSKEVALAIKRLTDNK